MPEIIPLPPDYDTWLADLKTRIQRAQQRASLAINCELVMLYWQIGRDILDRQNREGWGAKVIERLSQDLRNSFPGMKGFSPRNLKYMRSFAEAWPDTEFVQEVLAQLPWSHQIALLDKLTTEEKRRWYAAKAIEHGWSRNVLVIQIETHLRERSGQAITNFTACLPLPLSDLANESLKDPYRLDFLGLGENAQERALENSIVSHITHFLLELGSGFAYVGRQVHMEIGGEDFFIDLLFYHLSLRCFIVIELKTGPFRPEYIGQLNFYLSAIDSQKKAEHDNPSIGLLLCKSKNKVVAEYALRDSSKPIGIAEYQLIGSLPSELKTSLPSQESLEQALAIDTMQNNEI